MYFHVTMKLSDCYKFVKHFTSELKTLPDSTVYIVHK